MITRLDLVTLESTRDSNDHYVFTSLSARTKCNSVIWRGTELFRVRPEWINEPSDMGSDWGNT